MLTLDYRDHVDELVQVAPNVEGRPKIWQVYYRKQSLEQQNFRLKACLTRVGVVGQWTPTRQWHLQAVITYNHFYFLKSYRCLLVAFVSGVRVSAS